MNENDDLPMLSNINEFNVNHYILNYNIDFTRSQFYLDVILFIFKKKIVDIGLLTKGKNDLQDNEAINEIILDCCDLEIQNVYQIIGHEDKIIDFLDNPSDWGNDNYKYWINHPQKECKFNVEKWSLSIFINNMVENYAALKIRCLSLPNGRSINWRIDQNNNKCLFTAGSCINNRSIIPCQDHPEAMATWQCCFIIPDDYYASCTGDCAPNKYTVDNDKICYYYFTLMPMPIATFALAVGKWEYRDLNSIETLESHKYKGSRYQDYNQIKCNHIPYNCNIKSRDSGPIIHMSVVAPSRLIEKAVGVLQNCEHILKSSYELLGNHPFNRLQFIILPRSFNSLGLSSPNIIFLSQTLLIEDSNTYFNLAHEISHTWFGILIGPKNWNEEWLTEGFASYIENHIYLECNKFPLKAMDVKNSINDNFKKEIIEVKNCIMYKKLIQENSNSINEEMQCLTQKGKNNEVRNALDVSKSFLQVHYSKGFFLLQFLSKSVGVNSFNKFLKLYIIRYHGCLVTSECFFDLFYEYFPHMREIIKYQIIQSNWLCNPGVNDDIHSLGRLNENNMLIHNIISHFNNIKNEQNINISLPCFVLSEQLLLFLELLLEIPIFCSKLLKDLYIHYKICDQNAEVKHRWYELVIKHKYKQTTELDLYLIENQSMGVYLYGEMILSNNSKYIKLAKDVYSYLKMELDPSNKEILKEMIFGVV